MCAHKVNLEMKTTTLKFPQALSFLRIRINSFYLVAFMPLLLILYYNVWVLAIAFYGFVFFLLKSDKLRSAKNPKWIQKIFSILIAVGSFFLYYLLVWIVPTASFYSGANYVVFLLGLFLFFFDVSEWKQAFTPLFFIVAATSSATVADLLGPLFSPHLSEVANIIVGILKALGMDAYILYTGAVPVIGFTSLSGSPIITAFVYECIGIFGALVFSIILVIVLIEDSSRWGTRLLASVAGVAGTFLVNIIRITLILITDYLYGTEAGAVVHYFIGYMLFSAWLVIFLFVYYKRQIIGGKIQTLVGIRNSGV